MPNNKPGSRLIKAAGGVAWRPGPDGEPEILLVHRKKYDDWSLPKGKMEPGEPLPVTAVREVLEEGGARLALGRRLASVRYNVGGRPKRVHYWAARVLSVDKHAVPNSEVDEVTWVTAARAVDKVSYVHDHGVLADFAARPARTVPLILLRHSKAAAKNGWKRTDAARPLDDSGRSDAKALADLLACFAPSPRLISSTAVRCADTLRPLAQLTGEQVRLEKSLYIHNQPPRTGAADSGSDITALVRAVIASGEPTVICAHRENLPVLQQAALAALAGRSDGAAGAAAPGDASAELPKEWNEPLPTSGFWVLNVAPLPPPPGPGPAGQAGRNQNPGAAPDPNPSANLGPNPRLGPASDPGVAAGPGVAADPGMAADQGVAATAPAPEAPDPAAPPSAPRRRWWQLRRARAIRAAAARPVGGAAGTNAAAGKAAPGGAAPGGAAPGNGAAAGKTATGGAATGNGAAAGKTEPGNVVSADVTVGVATGASGKGRHPGDSGVSSSETHAGGASGASPAGRLGVLVSADRYDLSEP
jgi:8-oxo-dGTP pyrophosphatase MutT (NUDIX family)/phosphohistidine phosphatase SixA